MANYYRDRTAVLSATPDLSLVVLDDSGNPADQFSTLWSGDFLLKRADIESTVSIVEPTSLKRRVGDSKFGEFQKMRSFFDEQYAFAPIYVDDVKKRRTYVIADKSTSEDTHAQIAVFSTVHETDYQKLVDQTSVDLRDSLDTRRIVYNASTTSPVLDGAIFFQPSIQDVAHLSHEPSVAMWDERLRPPQIYILNDGTFYIDQQGDKQSTRMQEHFEQNIQVLMEGDNVVVMLGANMLWFPKTPDLSQIKKTIERNK